jgi:hypothetical protein
MVPTEGEPGAVVHDLDHHLGVVFADHDLHRSTRVHECVGDQLAHGQRGVVGQLGAAQVPERGGHQPAGSGHARGVRVETLADDDRARGIVYTCHRVTALPSVPSGVPVRAYAVCRKTHAAPRRPSAPSASGV